MCIFPYKACYNGHPLIHTAHVVYTTEGDRGGFARNDSDDNDNICCLLFIRT